MQDPSDVLEGADVQWTVKSILQANRILHDNSEPDARRQEAWQIRERLRDSILPWQADPEGGRAELFHRLHNAITFGDNVKNREALDVDLQAGRPVSLPGGLYRLPIRQDGDPEVLDERGMPVKAGEPFPESSVRHTFMNIGKAGRYFPEVNAGGNWVRLNRIEAPPVGASPFGPSTDMNGALGLPIPAFKTLPRPEAVGLLPGPAQGMQLSMASGVPALSGDLVQNTLDDQQRLHELGIDPLPGTETLIGSDGKMLADIRESDGFFGFNDDGFLVPAKLGAMPAKIDDHGVLSAWDHLTGPYQVDENGKQYTEDRYGERRERIVLETGQEITLPDGTKKALNPGDLQEIQYRAGGGAGEGIFGHFVHGGGNWSRTWKEAVESFVPDIVQEVGYTGDRALELAGRITEALPYTPMAVFADLISKATTGEPLSEYEATYANSFWVDTPFGKMGVPQITGDREMDRMLMERPEFQRAVLEYEGSGFYKFMQHVGQTTAFLAEFAATEGALKVGGAAVSGAARASASSLVRPGSMGAKVAGKAMAGVEAAKSSPIVAFTRQTAGAMRGAVEAGGKGNPFRVNPLTLDLRGIGSFIKYDVTKNAVTGNGTFVEGVQSGIASGMTLWAAGYVARFGRRAMLKTAGASLERMAEISASPKLQRGAFWSKLAAVSKEELAAGLAPARWKDLLDKGLKTIKRVQGNGSQAIVRREASELLEKELRPLVKASFWSESIDSSLVGLMFGAYGEARRKAEQDPNLDWNSMSLEDSARLVGASMFSAAALAEASVFGVHHMLGSRSRSKLPAYMFLGEAGLEKFSSLNERLVRDLSMNDHAALGAAAMATVEQTNAQLFEDWDRLEAGDGHSAGEFEAELSRRLSEARGTTDLLMNEEGASFAHDWTAHLMDKLMQPNGQDLAFAAVDKLEIKYLEAIWGKMKEYPIYGDGINQMTLRPLRERVAANLRAKREARRILLADKAVREHAREQGLDEDQILMEAKLDPRWLTEREQQDGANIDEMSDREVAALTKLDRYEHEEGGANVEAVRLTGTPWVVAQKPQAEDGGPVTYGIYNRKTKKEHSGSLRAREKSPRIGESGEPLVKEDGTPELDSKPIVFKSRQEAVRWLLNTNRTRLGSLGRSWERERPSADEVANDVRRIHERNEAWQRIEDREAVEEGSDYADVAMHDESSRRYWRSSDAEAEILAEAEADRKQAEWNAADDVRRAKDREAEIERRRVKREEKRAAKQARAEKAKQKKREQRDKKISEAGLLEERKANQADLEEGMKEEAKQEALGVDLVEEARRRAKESDITEEERQLRLDELLKVHQASVKEKRAAEREEKRLLREQKKAERAAAARKKTKDDLAAAKEKIRALREEIKAVKAKKVAARKKAAATKKEAKKVESGPRPVIGNYTTPALEAIVTSERIGFKSYEDAAKAAKANPEDPRLADLTPQMVGILRGEIQPLKAPSQATLSRLGELKATLRLLPEYSKVPEESLLDAFLTSADLGSNDRLRSKINLAQRLLVEHHQGDKSAVAKARKPKVRVTRPSSGTARAARNAGKRRRGEKLPSDEHEQQQAALEAHLENLDRQTASTQGEKEDAPAGLKAAQSMPGSTPETEEAFRFGNGIFGRGTGGAVSARADRVTSGEEADIVDEVAIEGGVPKRKSSVYQYPGWQEALLYGVKNRENVPAMEAMAMGILHKLGFPSNNKATANGIFMLVEALTGVSRARTEELIKGARAFGKARIADILAGKSEGGRDIQRVFEILFQPEAKDAVPKSAMRLLELMASAEFTEASATTRGKKPDAEKLARVLRFAANEVLGEEVQGDQALGVLVANRIEMIRVAMQNKGSEVIPGVSMPANWRDLRSTLLDASKKTMVGKGLIVSRMTEAELLKAAGLTKDDSPETIQAVMELHYGRSLEEIKKLGDVHVPLDALNGATLDEAIDSVFSFVTGREVHRTGGSVDITLLGSVEGYGGKSRASTRTGEGDEFNDAAEIYGREKTIPDAKEERVTSNKENESFSAEEAVEREDEIAEAAILSADMKARDVVGTISQMHTEVDGKFEPVVPDTLEVREQLELYGVNALHVTEVLRSIIGGHMSAREMFLNARRSDGSKMYPTEEAAHEAFEATRATLGELAAEAQEIVVGAFQRMTGSRDFDVGAGAEVKAFYAHLMAERKEGHGGISSEQEAVMNSTRTPLTGVTERFRDGFLTASYKYMMFDKINQAMGVSERTRHERSLHTPMFGGLPLAASLGFDISSVVAGFLPHPEISLKQTRDQFSDRWRIGNIPDWMLGRSASWKQDGWKMKVADSLIRTMNVWWKQAARPVSGSLPSDIKDRGRKFMRGRIQAESHQRFMMERMSQVIRHIDEMGLSQAQESVMMKVINAGGFERIRSEEEWTKLFGKDSAGMFHVMQQVVSLLNDIGREAVNAGVLSPTQYKKHMNRYMPSSVIKESKMISERYKAALASGMSVTTGNERGRDLSTVFDDMLDEGMGFRDSMAAAVTRELARTNFFVTMNHLLSAGITSEQYRALGPLEKRLYRKAVEANGKGQLTGKEKADLDAGLLSEKEAEEIRKRRSQHVDPVQTRSQVMLEMERSASGETGPETEIKSKLLERWEDTYIPDSMLMEVDLALDMMDPGNRMKGWSAGVQQVIDSWKGLRTHQSPRHWFNNFNSSIVTNHMTGRLDASDFFRSVMFGKGHYADAFKSAAEWILWVDAERPFLNDPSAMRRVMEFQEHADMLGSGTFMSSTFDAKDLASLMKSFVTPDGKTIDLNSASAIDEAVALALVRGGSSLQGIDRKLSYARGDANYVMQANAQRDLGRLYQAQELAFKFAAAKKHMSRGASMQEAVEFGASGTANYANRNPSMYKLLSRFRFALTPMEEVATREASKAKNAVVMRQARRAFFKSVGGTFWGYNMEMLPTLAASLFNNPGRFATGLLMHRGFHRLAIGGAALALSQDDDREQELQAAAAGSFQFPNKPLPRAAMQHLEDTYGNDMVSDPNNWNDMSNAKIKYRDLLRLMENHWESLDSQAGPSRGGRTQSVDVSSKTPMLGMAKRAMDHVGGREDGGMATAAAGALVGLSGEFGAGLPITTLLATTGMVADLVAGLPDKTRLETLLSAGKDIGQEGSAPFGGGVFPAPFAKESMKFWSELTNEGRTFSEGLQGIRRPALQSDSYGSRAYRAVFGLGFGAQELPNMGAQDPNETGMRRALRGTSAGRLLFKMRGEAANAEQGANTRFAKRLRSQVSELFADAYSMWSNRGPEMKDITLSGVLSGYVDIERDIRLDGKTNQWVFGRQPQTEVGKFIASRAKGDKAMESDMIGQARALVDRIDYKTIAGLETLMSNREVHPHVVRRVAFAAMKGKGDILQVIKSGMESNPESIRTWRYLFDSVERPSRDSSSWRAYEELRVLFNAAGPQPGMGRGEATKNTLKVLGGRAYEYMNPADFGNLLEMHQ